MPTVTASSKPPSGGRSEQPKTTACVLLYGDYPHLAERCLVPLLRLAAAGLIELRVGCNEISSRTEDFLARWLVERIENVRVFRSQENILKYPMMRLLFGHGHPLAGPAPIRTDFLMWFDDDSYVKHPQPHKWLAETEARMDGADMLGSVYTMKAPHTDTQVAWIAAQPWYGGRPVLNPPKFATGGWWLLRSEIVYRYNWPVTDILHDGGDTMLGELLNQQDLKLAHYNTGVAINADAQGRESKAERRGRSGRTPRAGTQPFADRK